MHSSFSSKLSYIFSSTYLKHQISIKIVFSRNEGVLNIQYALIIGE